MTTLQYIQFAALRTFINANLYIKRSSWSSPATQPNKTKIYNNRNDLFAARIFSPQDQSNGPYPLVILVHGGGFILNNPSADDPLARQLADEASCVVVSIDYRKSPQTRFPGAYEDIVSQSLAIIQDQELPVDPKRVVLGGSSAGGNLVLGVAQDERLKGKLCGVLGIYPPVDWRLSVEERMKSRANPDVPDFLGKSVETVRELYLDPIDKVNSGDVRLSPTCFKERKDLPRNMLIVGAEDDMLCREAELMAERLAEGEERVGTEGGWKTASVRWHLVKGQKHGFDHFVEKDKEKEEVRTQAKERMYGLFVEWLREVFSTQS